MTLQEQTLTNLGYVKKDKHWWVDENGYYAKPCFRNLLVVNTDAGSVVLEKGKAIVNIGATIIDRKWHLIAARTLDIAEEYNRLAGVEK